MKTICPNRLVGLAGAVSVLIGCSITTYTRLPAVNAPADDALWPALTAASAPISPPLGRVVLEVKQGQGAVREKLGNGESALVCAATPCVHDAAPGTHRYQLVPPAEAAIGVRANGVVLSKDGVYSAPVEADVVVEAGRTHVLAANLGRTEVHRSFPVGRGVGWALIGAGVAIAIVGLVNASSAPGGSPDEQVAQGWTEIGTGVAILGGALWLWNVQDNVTVGEHPGAVRQWATP